MDVAPQRSHAVKSRIRSEPVRRAVWSATFCRSGPGMRRTLLKEAAVAPTKGWTSSQAG